MSSIAVPSPTAITPPANPDSGSSGNGSGNNTGDVTRGANYFFGFLITFVTLLLIFVACGIGSRRRFVARRRAMGDFDPWTGVHPGSMITNQKPPKFFESTLHQGGTEWECISPLSAAYISEEKDSKQSNPEEPRPYIHPAFAALQHPTPVVAAEHHLHNPVHATANAANDPAHPESRQSHTRCPLPSVASHWFRFHHKDDSFDEKVPEFNPPEEMQIAVIIGMPSSPYDQPPDRAHPRFPEYQVGVVRMPWNYEEMSHIPQ